MLCLDDLFVLAAPLAQEVQRCLPIPAVVSFCLVAADGSLQPLRHPVGSLAAGSVETIVGVEPQLLDDRLILPLLLPSGERALATVSEADPALLKKISPTWLQTLQHDLPERFETIRLAYIDVETELYNRRAAELFFQQAAVGAKLCFFLLNTALKRRSAGATLQKNKEIADLLQVLTHGLCFSFGFGVFGIVREVRGREQALKAAHYLQHQLKQEGLHTAQIGFAAVHGASRGGEKDLERLWRALVVAEKRGPFGLCDIDAADERHTHPFQLCAVDVLASLKKAWRARPSFTLAALSLPLATDVAALEQGLETLVRGMGRYIGMADNLALVLFERPDEQPIRKFVDRVQTGCLQKDGATLSAGVASWPCLDFARTDVPGNCLKALLHASFLGPGSVVFFDSLTLNISGDVFFEEGDYRAAIREYRRGLKWMPGDVNLINSLGVALVECNQERQAAVCFQEALGQEPDNYMALVNLGNVSLTLGQLPLALDCFERALGVRAGEDAGRQELLSSIARLYTDLGRHERATPILEEWRSLPGSEREFLLFRLLGRNYLETGRPAEAIVACQRALRLFPQDSVSMSLLGLLYVEQGEGRELGLTLCRKALALDNFNADHWYRLGRALFHSDDPKAALEAARRCLKLRRGHVAASLLLGAIHQLAGRQRQAERCFRKAVSLQGCSPQQAELARQHLAGFGKGRTAKR